MFLTSGKIRPTSEVVVTRMIHEVFSSLHLQTASSSVVRYTKHTIQFPPKFKGNRRIKHTIHSDLHGKKFGLRSMLHFTRESPRCYNKLHKRSIAGSFQLWIAKKELQPITPHTEETAESSNKSEGK